MLNDSKMTMTMPRGTKELASWQNSFRESGNGGTQTTQLKYNEVLRCASTIQPAVLSRSEVESIEPRRHTTRYKE
jgi:hypothetical protein